MHTLWCLDSTLLHVLSLIKLTKPSNILCSWPQSAVSFAYQERKFDRQLNLIEICRADRCRLLHLVVVSPLYDLSSLLSVSSSRLNKYWTFVYTTIAIIRKIIFRSLSVSHNNQKIPCPVVNAKSLETVDSLQSTNSNSTFLKWISIVGIR